MQEIEGEEQSRLKLQVTEIRHFGGAFHYDSSPNSGAQGRRGLWHHAVGQDAQVHVEPDGVPGDVAGGGGEQQSTYVTVADVEVVLRICTYTYCVHTYTHTFVLCRVHVFLTWVHYRTVG